MEFNDAWDLLEEMGTQTQTLQVMVDAHGKTMETLEDILYVLFGYRSFDQLTED